MNVKNPDRGGVLLETILFVLILALFALGTARIHSALGARFASIVRHRNEAIRAARAP
jgi:Tfp pilus assembly protein PilX